MKNEIPVSTLFHNKATTLWSIAPEASVFEAIKLMAEKNIGSLPVLAGGKLLGVFTERDYTRNVALQGKSSRETRVHEIISSQLVTVTPTDSIADCMRLMTENRVRHLPVVDGDKVIGIVSIGDLVNWIISAQDATIAQMEQYIAGGVAA
jgi:CBS domain-containing protein